ncbi:hypothetical protein ACFVKB_48305, partial [Rhodococcus sp. NPDC127530]|uniref:hypothetical protein n=1 Tax=unclassified Rhodococcus (in: high G+C Gram-positive bacteria) TaxID=192944 RepID=UPI00363C531F
PYARSAAPRDTSEDRKPQAERPLLNNYGTLAAPPTHTLQLRARLLTIPGVDAATTGLRNESPII